jgi:hypothetical protein
MVIGLEYGLKNRKTFYSMDYFFVFCKQPSS